MNSEFFQHQALRKLIPHRYPFLLIDRLIDCRPFESATFAKNVSANESVFSGHFPDFPIMPAALIIEAAAQSMSAFLKLSSILRQETEASDTTCHVESLQFDRLAKVDFKFYRIVTPGDRLKIVLRLTGKTQNSAKLTAEVFVEEELVAKGKMIGVHS